MWRSALFAMPVLILSGVGPVFAQQQGGAELAPLQRGSVISPILTIDSDRVFNESAFGKRVAQEVEEKGAALVAENSRIQQDLETEERDLTAKRATMDPAEFRVLADAFDKKVQEIRQAQAQKGRALNELLDKERDVFLSAAAPVLERLMRDAGAAVILERRSVFVSAAAIEITDDAIDLLDDTLGAGETANR